jgi:phosphoglycolate phosphatase
MVFLADSQYDILCIKHNPDMCNTRGNNLCNQPKKAYLETQEEKKMSVESAGFEEIICFDLDGTLVNSQEAHAQSFNLAFEKNNLPTWPIDLIISKFGPTAEEIVKEIFPKISSRKLAAVVEDKRKIFNESCYKLTREIPGIAEALEELSKNFKLAVISNSIHSEIIAILKTVGIKQSLFSAILGYGEIHAKPDPDIMEKVEEIANGKVIWMVGDTTFDINLGKNAEIKTIAVLTGVHDVATLGTAKPTVTIESVALLPEYFEGEL